MFVSKYSYCTFCLCVIHQPGWELVLTTARVPWGKERVDFFGLQALAFWGEGLLIKWKTKSWLNLVRVSQLLNFHLLNYQCSLILWFKLLFSLSIKFGFFSCRIFCESVLIDSARCFFLLWIICLFVCWEFYWTR